MMMTIERRWRKASRSNDNGACVELAGNRDAARDSKNPDGPVLEYSPTAMEAFLAAVKGGRFDG